MNGSITSIFMTMIAAGPPAAAVDDVASAVQVNSIWDFVVKGGVMMIPIGLCSLVALGVFAERIISLRRSNVIPSSFLPGLKAALRKHPNDRQHALKYCQKDGSPIANVFAAGIKRLGGPIEIVEKHIQEAGEREVLKLRRFVRVLSVIAAISPLLGLLGTIFGMINAFQTVAMSGEALGKAELLAEGIYEAMITTAAGLCIAIPVLVCYHFISAKIEKLVMEIDQTTVDFLEDYDSGVLSLTEEEAAPRASAAASAAASDTLPEGPDVQVAAT